MRAEEEEDDDDDEGGRRRTKEEEGGLSSIHHIFFAHVSPAQAFRLDETLTFQKRPQPPKRGLQNAWEVLQFFAHVSPVCPLHFPHPVSCPTRIRAIPLRSPGPRVLRDRAQADGAVSPLLLRGILECLG